VTYYTAAAAATATAAATAAATATNLCSEYPRNFLHK
jgi:hypothetical protein